MEHQGLEWNAGTEERCLAYYIIAPALKSYHDITYVTKFQIVNINFSGFKFFPISL